MLYTDLPNEVLNNLVCDNCFKCLSVPPITMNAGRTLCGRCVDSNQNGTESFLNVFLDNILFKCINRFDGCTALLTSSQVVPHEMDCTGQKYRCPLCQKTTSKMWSYLLPHHIKKNHSSSYLTQNNFKIILGDSKNKTFFYSKENFLFFIQYTLEDGAGVVTLSLNASYLGGSDIQPYFFQTYCVESSQHLLTTQKRECLHIKHFQTVNNGNRIIIEQPYQSIYVTFYLEAASTSLIPSTESKADILKTALVQKMEACKKNSCLFARQIKLSKYQPICMLNKNRIEETANILSLNDTRTKLIIRLSSSQIISICDHCILCNKIFNLSMWVTDHGTDRHLVCIRCEQLLSDYMDLIPFRSVLNLQYLTYQYICKFCLCEQLLENKDSGYGYDHSMSCNKVENKRCCFKSCRYSFNDINMASQHFREMHGIAYIRFDCDYFQINTKQKKSVEEYRLSRLTDVFILLRLDYIDEDYFLSAEVCDKDHSFKMKHVLVMVFYKETMIGRVLESKLKLDADSDYTLKFAIL